MNNRSDTEVKKSRSLLKKVISARGKYESALQELTDHLEDKVDFEFSIEFQNGDGHMLLDVNNGFNLAPISDCLSVIQSKGKLSEEEHEKLCI